MMIVHSGLTLLLPYIISNRSKWSECKLRVFCTAENQQQLSVKEQE